MAHQDHTADRPDLAALIVEALRTLHTSYEQAVEQHNSAKARQCAKEALVFAELLIDNLTEWAVDDVIRSRANDPKTVPTKRKLKAKTDDRALDRVLIAEAIATGGIVPQIYRQELQLALKALNLGEARPLLRPSLTGRWRDPFSLSECWQLAILHVLCNHTRIQSYEQPCPIARGGFIGRFHFHQVYARRPCASDDSIQALAVGAPE